MGGRTLKITSRRVPASQRWVKGRPAISPMISTRALDARVGVERKYYDVECGTSIPANITWTLASNTLATNFNEPRVLQGDDLYQRNGRKILVDRVQVKGNIFTSTATLGAAVAAPTTVRLVLYHQYGNETPTNIIAKADNTAFANTASALGGFASPQIFGNGKIVADETFHLDPGAAANNAAATSVSSTSNEKTVEFSYRPKKPIEIYYQPAASLPNKYFTLLGNAESVTGYTPSFNGVIRFYYTDA